MEPVTALTYIVISHYACYVVTNFYDYLYQWRFEFAPQRGAIIQTITGNLVEELSADNSTTVW